MLLTVRHRLPEREVAASWRKRLERSLRRQLAEALAEALADGRERWVRMLPLREERDAALGLTLLQRQAVCLLKLAGDAEVGEDVCFDSLPDPGPGVSVLETVHPGPFPSAPLWAGPPDDPSAPPQYQLRRWSRLKLYPELGGCLSYWRREA